MSPTLRHTGVDAVDTAHEHLLVLLHRAADSPSAAHLDHLAAEVEAHFAEEAPMMAHLDADLRDWHLAAHGRFLDGLLRLRALCAAGADAARLREEVAVLTVWFVVHSNTDDMTMTEALRHRESAAAADHARAGLSALAAAHSGA